MNRYEFLKEHIHPIQEKLSDNLIFENNNFTIYTKTEDNKTLSKGCQACKSGSWFNVHLGFECNLNCKYCAQGSFADKKERDIEYKTQTAWLDETKMIINHQSNKLKGVSYVGGETFLFYDKLIDIADYVCKNHPNIYQWVYTNGTILDESKLIQMKEVGISEIRFHWGATKFSDNVFNNMKLAKKYIDFVNIETPSLLETKRAFVDKEKLKELEAIGISQINLCELAIINNHIFHNFQSEELYKYEGKFFNCSSPKFSRQITYEIIDYALKNNIKILINDCSNDSKNLQCCLRQISNIIGSV